MGDTDLTTTMPNELEVRQTMKAIEAFRKVVHECLVDGIDYGIIPSTTKPTLLKPGAEKIVKLLGLANESEIVEQINDWAQGLFHFVVRMRLTHISSGVVVASGLGEANSMEAKYRWRDAKRKCPKCGAEAIIKGKEEYGGGWVCFKKQGGCGAKFNIGDTTIGLQKTGRVENDDIYSLVNTILKMAEKRALVGAALSVGRLSDVFTQDIEDIPPSSTTTTAPPTKAPGFGDGEAGDLTTERMAGSGSGQGSGSGPASGEQLHEMRKQLESALREKGINLASRVQVRDWLENNGFFVSALTALGESELREALEKVGK